MGKDLLTELIDHLAYNRPMPREKVIERFKEIVSSQSTRELNLYQPLKVDLNEQEGEVEIFSSKEVIGIVQNENSQIELQEAIKIKPDAELGEIIYVRVQPDLVKSLLPGVTRELYTGISEEYRQKGKTDRTQTGQKEAGLKGIEEGEKGPMGPSKEFYQPFEQDVEMTEASTGDAKKDPIPTDVICERCGSRMVIRWRNISKNGRFRQFLACSNYPTCKFAQVIEGEVRCPQKGCDGMLVERRTRKGDVFYGCSNYPRCTFALWNKPISNESPQSLWNDPKMSTNSGIRDEGRENEVGMGKGQIIDDYRLAETYKTRNLPRIPDLPELTPVSPSEKKFEEHSDTEVPERDTPDLISILANERSGIKDDQKELPSLLVPSDELEPNCEEVLLEIERALSEHDYLQMRKKLNELHVEVTLSNRSFTTVFHIYNQMVTAKSLLPFAKDAAADLLELCGQADFTSSIGKVSQGGKHFYVIKSNCSLRGVSRKILWQMAFQPILEASKAIEIIEGYWKNGDFRD
jgi:ssDNA-binding Zn-finger/Zn-ribbon topoisomerase 1